jgi:hypothetical protein
VAVIAVAISVMYFSKIAGKKLGYIPTGQQFVNSLQSGQFEVARTDLAPDLQKKYSVEKLKNITAAVVKKYGPLKPVMSMLGGTNQAQPTMNYSLQGANTGAVLSMTFDSTTRAARITELTWPAFGKQ